jgi:hypothetical protein
MTMKSLVVTDKAAAAAGPYSLVAAGVEPPGHG